MDPLKELEASFPPPLAAGRTPSVTGSERSDEHDGSGTSSVVSRRSTRKASAEPTEVRETLGSNEFIVERILGYRQVNKVRQARVKWLGFAETTWEPANQIFLYKPSHKNGRKDRKAEYLVDRRIRKGKVEYKVHWSGFPDACDSWIRETASALVERQDLVKKYLREHPVFGGVTPVRHALHSSTNDHKGRPALNGPDASTEKTDGIKLLPQEAKHLFSAENPRTGTEEPLAEKTKPEPVPYVLPKPVPFAVERKLMSEWTTADIAEFLTHKGFPDAAAILQARNMDGNELRSKYLDPAALRTLGILIGPGLKIVKLLRDAQGLTAQSGAVSPV
ncbi:hypothetical protein BV898_08035 [Hypsibius exemplaris]|uniref:Chromo domain-containing protein n=1 Tax=Hypsibius exemplaris TaxID=2072580 RepID=A0A1W0WRS2_HYPEX|nr:hypothetical protein BV898_08035 [Hypsibius exemplaris]